MLSWRPMCRSWGSPESEAYILGRSNHNWMWLVLFQHLNRRRYQQPFIGESASTRAVTEWLPWTNRAGGRRPIRVPQRSFRSRFQFPVSCHSCRGGRCRFLEVVSRLSDSELINRLSGRSPGEDYHLRVSRFRGALFGKNRVAFPAFRVLPFTWPRCNSYLRASWQIYRRKSPRNF